MRTTEGESPIVDHPAVIVAIVTGYNTTSVLISSTIDIDSSALPDVCNTVYRRFLARTNFAPDFWYFCFDAFVASREIRLFPQTSETPTNRTSILSRFSRSSLSRECHIRVASKLQKLYAPHARMHFVKIYVTHTSRNSPRFG